MRSILLFAAAAVLAGTYGARFADTATKQTVQPQTVAATASYEPRQPVHSGRSLTLESGKGGHFHIEARINSRDLAFIVDTGASLVILRESDAAKIGIHPMRSEYTATVSTANGRIKAAPAMLERVEVAGITVYDVRALVLPDEALWQNLLGMSFLSKLRRYEVANGRMILEE